MGKISYRLAVIAISIGQFAAFVGAYAIVNHDSIIDIAFGALFIVTGLITGWSIWPDRPETSKHTSLPSEDSARE